jgi:hypothetical protein
MLQAIKQEVTVLPNGVIPFRSPELKAGSRAEVFVILKENSENSLPLLQEYDTLQNVQIEPTLTELLTQAATEKERMTLTYRKQLFLAVVPIEDIEVFQQLKSGIEEYTKHPVTTIRVDDALGEFLETVVCVARLTLNYQDKVWLAVAPIEDFYLIEELEECIDCADARDALKEAEEKGFISSEQLDKELGW